MPITNSDIKLLESERLTDTDDGGGRATGREITSGAINALFNPIDRIDQAFGELSAKKVFGGPQTADNAVYFGAHSAVIQDAADPNINILMVDTKSDSDTQADLKNFIESYQVKSIRTMAQLWGDHLQHQQSLLVYQPVSEDVPTPSEVLFLKNGNTEQAVRIKAVESEIRSVTVVSGNGTTEVSLRRLTLDLFNSLETDYPGRQPDLSFSQTTTEIYTSRPSQGVKYYGVKKLAQAMAAGSSVANVADPFLPLAPASKRTQPIVNQFPYEHQLIRVPISETDESLSTTLYREGTSRNYSAYLPWLPGVKAQVVIGSNVLQDTGDGEYRVTSGGEWESLSIDFASRKVSAVRSASASVSSSYAATFTGKPSVLTAGQVANTGIVITTENHRTSYIFDLNEVPPRLETLKVQFRVLGKSYYIYSNGDGNLYGDGTGRIDPINNILQITLPALPDINSTILVTWASNIGLNLASRLNKQIESESKFEYVLQHPIEVGSLVATWSHSGSDIVASDDGTGQLVIGADVVGKIAYSNADGVGEVLVTPIANYPDPGTQISIDYNQSTVISQQVDVAGGASEISAVLAQTPEPGSITLSVQTKQFHDVDIEGVISQSEFAIRRLWTDDSAGIMQAEGLTGTVDYATKSLQINPCAGYLRTVISTYEKTWSSAGGTVWNPATSIVGDVIAYSGGSGSSGRSITKTETAEVADIEELPTQTVFIKYQAQGVVGIAQTETFAVGNLVLKLDKLLAQPIMPGSVRLVSNGKTIIDRNGILLRDVNAQTGAGTQVGTIDYANHVAYLAEWQSHQFLLKHLASIVSAAAIDVFMFTTVTAPVAPNGLIINGVGLHGERYSATANADGSLQGDFEGVIDVSNGLLLAYIPDDVDPNKRKPIIPSTLTYSCVIEQLVPLDKEIINIDPIRLPPDGRVPIYREGDLLLLAHTQKDEVATLSEGQVLNAGRDYLAFADIVDSNGESLKESERTLDLVGGKVTLATPLNQVNELGTALVPPFQLVHRVEHMTPVSDVQLNGDIGLLTPNYHAFPANDTVVCSCPIHGDKWSREYQFFTQNSWNSSNPVWSDERVGSDTTAKFDTLNYPVELTNDGAINERWAIVFTSSTSFNVVGETLGIIASGNTSTDTAPINPNTGKPYFVLRAGGWGTGWATSNVVRFNTDASISPIWLIRVTQPGKLEHNQDEFVYQMRGDVV